MPRDRLGIQKVTFIKRTTLHTHIVPTLRSQGQGDTQCSAAS